MTAGVVQVLRQVAAQPAAAVRIAVPRQADEVRRGVERNAQPILGQVLHRGGCRLRGREVDLVFVQPREAADARQFGVDLLAQLFLIVQRAVGLVAVEHIALRRQFRRRPVDRDPLGRDREEQVDAEDVDRGPLGVRLVLLIAKYQPRPAVAALRSNGISRTSLA